MVYASIATFLITISTFLFGFLSKKGAVIKNVCSIGYLFIGMLIISIQYMKFTARYGHGPRFHDTSLYDSKQSKYKKSGLFYTLTGGLLSFFGELAFVYALKYTQEAGVNQGVMASLLVGVVLVVSVSSIFIFKEKISTLQIVGIVAIAGGLFVFCTSVYQTHFLESTNGVDFALLLGSTRVVCFGVRSLISKHLSKNEGIDNITFAISSLIIDGLIGTSIEISRNIFGSSDLFSLTSLEFSAALFIGICGGMAIVFINMAVTEGFEKHTIAATNTAFLFMMLLDWVVLGQSIGSLQIVGVAVATAGAAITLLGDSVMTTIKRKKENKFIYPKGYDLSEPRKSIFIEENAI